MASAAWLATYQDAEAIRRNVSAGTTPTVDAIYPRGTKPADLPVLDGPALAQQLGGRFLLRYCMADQVEGLRKGMTERAQYATPTAYTPEDAGDWLHLPVLHHPRLYAFVLAPEKLTNVRGPKWVDDGGGIEYILDSGFEESAIVGIVIEPSYGRLLGSRAAAER